MAKIPPNSRPESREVCNYVAAAEQTTVNYGGSGRTHRMNGEGTASAQLASRHGTGSLGHRVIFHARVTGHSDPVCDPSLSGFRKNAQNAKRTFEMLT